MVKHEMPPKPPWHVLPLSAHLRTGSRGTERKLMACRLLEASLWRRGCLGNFADRCKKRNISEATCSPIPIEGSTVGA